MAQFDVFRNFDQSSASFAPYLLDIQADVLRRTRTRVVAPLILDSERSVLFLRLNPTFTVEGHRVVMEPLQLSAAYLSDLGEAVASLEPRRYDIIGAIDMLVTGI